MKKNEKIIISLVVITLLLGLIITVMTNSEIYLLTFIGILGVIGTFLIVRYDWIMCIIIIFMSLCNSYIVFNLGINTKVLLLIDYFILLLLIKAIIKLLKRKEELEKTTTLILLVITIGIISLIISPINGNSINSLYYYVIRYPILGFAIYYSDISREKVKLIVKIVSIFIILQTPVVLFQSKFLNVIPGTRGIPVEGFVKQDFYSGLIGGKTTTELGFLIMLNIVYLYYMYVNKKVKLKSVSIVVILSILTVVINETKVVFILLPFILLILNLRNIKIKSVIGAVIVVAIAINGYSYIGKIYKGQSGVLIDKKTTLEYINMDYAGSGISRVNGVFIATKETSKNLYSLLLGYGPGRGLKQVNGAYNFKTFYFPGIIYENGYLSMICILIIFGLIFKYSLTLIKNIDKEISVLGNVGVALVIIILFSGFYSNSMNNCAFATIAWMIISLIAKTYRNCKDEVSLKRGYK